MGPRQRASHGSLAIPVMSIFFDYLLVDHEWRVRSDRGENFSGFKIGHQVVAHQLLHFEA